MIDIYELRATLGLDASGAIKGAKQATDAFQGLEKINNALSKTAVAAGAAIGAASIAIYKLGKTAYTEAARVQELDVSMKAIGFSTEIGYEAIKEATAGIRDMGIELGASQQIAIQFAQNNLDMAKAAEVARVAQDLAVISQRNSTEQTNLLTYAIITGRTELLKSAGIQKSAGQMYDEYALTIGKTAAGLNAMEKQQAVLNGVLQEGRRVAGTYKAAMEAPGKVIRSYPRLINDMYVELGKSVVVGFGPVIKAGYDMVKALSTSMRESASFRRILGALSVVLEYMVQPLMNMTEKLEKVFKSIFVGQTAVKNFAVTFMEFLPVIGAVAVGLSTLASRSILGMIPVLNRLAFAFNPVIAVMLALGATSPEIRKEFVNLFNAIKPLFPVILDLAQIIANGLVKVLQISLPIIRTFVEFIGGTVTAFVNFIKAGGLAVDAIKYLGIGLTVLIPLVVAYTKIKALATFITGSAFVKALMGVVNTIKLSSIPWLGALIAKTKIYTFFTGVATGATGIFAKAILALRAAIKLLIASTVIGAAIVAVGFLIDKFIMGKLAAEDLTGALGGVGDGVGDLDKFIADLEKGMSNLDDKFSLDLPAGLKKSSDELSNFDESLLGVNDGLGKTGSAVDKVKDRLTKLNNAMKSFTEFASDISDTRPVIQKSLETIGAEFEKFSKIMGKTKKRNIDDLISSFEELTRVTQENFSNAIADARNQLDQAKSNFKNFQNEISGSIKGILNFGKAAESENFLEGLNQQAEQATTFGEKVRKLIEMGLSESAIQQVLQTGYEAGSKIADEIIMGGQTVVDQVNKMVESVNYIAESVGYFGAEKFYQAGVDQAQALVDGLMQRLNDSLSQIKDWYAQVEKITKKTGQEDIIGGGGGGKGGNAKQTVIVSPKSVIPSYLKGAGFGSLQDPLQRGAGADTFTYGRGTAPAVTTKLKQQASLNKIIADSIAARSNITRTTVRGVGVTTPFGLADGGIVRRPSIAMIGEKGPEAVVPLNKMGGMGGATYNITVNAGIGTSGPEVGRQIVEAIKKFERSSGPVFQGA